MDVSPHAALLAFFLVTSAAIFILIPKLFTMQDPREPPVVPASVPYIGHVIGIMRNKFNYYVQLSQKYSLPICTMLMPGSKMYIANTPELIQAIQKNPKALAFPPIEAKFAFNVCGPSAEAHKIVMNNVNGEEGDWGLSMELYAAMRGALLPGPHIDEMNREMIRCINASLEDIKLRKGQHRTMNLASWLRETVTIATTNSVYGPQNPFKDASVVDAFWQFERELMTLIIGVLPSVMAPKAIAGRTKVAKALESYFRAGGHEKASTLTKVRYETSARNGVSVEDIARYEVGGAIAVLVNTAPAAFWMLLLVYSHPGLVDDIRKEVDPIVTTTESDGDSLRTLDVVSLKSDCPLLTSTFQEVLRFRSMGTSIRQVMEDTVLNETWLLKKDCMIQMPSRVIHKDASLWGTDVDEFNPRRFLKDEVQKTPNGKRPTAAAFRAFGGGTTLCPGRHFASNEILAVVTMFVLRYDMVPTEGKWSLPETKNTNVASVVMEPDTDIEVQVSSRKGYEDGRWAFGLKDSEKIFAVVAEDHE